MTITEYKELCKKDVIRIGQDVKEIKLGTNVKSKIHDDLTGSVVLLDRSNDYANGFDLTFDEEIELRDLTLGVWEADSEDDLIEEITTSSGWCIKSIDYDIQLK